MQCVKDWRKGYFPYRGARMRAVLASLTVWAALVFALSALPAAADPNDDQQLASINRRLSALASDPSSDSAKAVRPAAAATVPTLSTSALKPGVANLPPFMSGPKVMHLVANFHSLDRMMHYHSRGLDANFWGVFSHGRGLAIRYSRTF